MTLSETQEQILSSTMDIIVREGLAKVSMRAVAQEAEVSLGLLSYHFEDKDNLILSAFRRASERLIAVADERMVSAGGDPQAQITMTLRAIMDPEFLGLEQYAIWLTIWAAARTKPEVAKAEREFYDRLASQLFSAIAAACPEISAEQARDRTTDVMAFLNGLWINQARWGDDTALQRGLRRCEAMALGVAHEGDIRGPSPDKRSATLTAKIGDTIAGFWPRSPGVRRRSPRPERTPPPQTCQRSE